MRILFAGTPAFSVPALEAIIAAGHDVVAVYTQPDRQAGRGRKIRPAPVKQCALKHGLAVEQPDNLKDDDATQTMSSYGADAMVVVAYGLLLPQAILQIPAYGCLNIHASLLPRWRGAAPIQRAIEAGDRETGITIMQMDAGLDTGDILAQTPVTIEHTETGQTLHDKLADTGANTIIEVLNNIHSYRSQAIPQQDSLTTYAKKISKQDGNINWSENCEVIERRMRAFMPWPGSQSWYKGIKLRLSEAVCCDDDTTADPGTILSADKNGVRIACGKGVLRVGTLQRPGGKALPAAAFLNGMPLDAGVVLEQNGP